MTASTSGSPEPTPQSTAQSTPESTPASTPASTPESTPASTPASPQGPASDSPGAEPSAPRRGPRGWPRPLRWAALIGCLLALALLAVTVAGVVVVRRPLPQTSGTLTLPGLEGPVEVIRDGHGIPQLYGDSVPDLMRAQGYVHAQERFYEMDVRRHITAGRLAELFGPVAVDTDRVIRTLGWRRVAEQELALVSPTTRAWLQAYADGVNAYLHDTTPGQRSVAYPILGAGGLDYTPEDWTPVDSLAWLKAMAWDLRGNMDEEIARVLSSAGGDTDRVAELFPSYPYARHRPIVGVGAVVGGRFTPEAATTTAPLLRPAYAPSAAGPASRAALTRTRAALASVPPLVGHGQGLGSNSWVVDGEHSATGAPLLANDPHLGISLPGIWVQIGLHCRVVDEACPLDVAGFSFSGVPGVIIGHNADIAWGFTNLGPDVTDLFVEQVRGDRWRYAGEWLPLRTRTETIRVAGGSDVRLTVRETEHGPILSDVLDSLAVAGDDVSTPADTDRAVSLAWTALEPRPTADALLGLNLASTWGEFRAAARDFAVPAQNLVYADRAGHIGYQAPGRIPIRGPGNDGLTPSAGWLPRNDWTGEYVPFAALPWTLDPAEGFIVTANQAVIGPDYEYQLTQDWDLGYRAQRIRDLLVEEGELSVTEMAQLQLDDHNPMAAVLVPYLLDIPDLGSAYYRDGQRLLADWDGSQPADSAAAAYFNAVWAALLRLTFHDDLPEDVWPRGGDRWFAVVGQLLTQPSDPWWDDATTDEVETRDDILRQALLSARDELTRLQSPRAADWQWGRIHTLDLREATLGNSGMGPIEALMNRTGYQVGGGGAIVNATSWDATQGYQVTASPSMRMVVSLADFDDSRWINLTGVSGHPASPHYVDQTELWVAGRTLPWAFTEEAVTAAGADVLTFQPGAEE